jgi:hypothetical protein
MARTLPQQNKQAIEAALRAAGILPGMWARSISARAAAPAEDGGLEWLLTSELPALVWDWDRFELVSEVLIADGMLVPAIGQVPLLDSHNRYSALDVLGHVKDFKAAKAGSYDGKSGVSYFAADEKSQTVRQKVVDGHITDGSVGYSVSKAIWIPEGMEAAVMGKTFAGPLKVSYQWSLKEFSVTPIGADVLAKVRMLCG